jgi:micrococcal nuclease
MHDRSHRGTYFNSVTLACALVVGLAGPACLQAQSSSPSPTPGAATPSAAKTPLPPQPRKTRVRVPIAPSQIEIDDGDTAIVVWSAQDRETVRIIGIDTPETQHLPHNIPYPQPFGEEARGFASGAFGAATTIELLRAPTLDQYGRTLGYFFLNGKNYSVLVIAARLAEESVTQFGDNGFPQEAAAVLKAARAAGPLPFESPASYRLRMRNVADWMKAHGTYPVTQ